MQSNGAVICFQKYTLGGELSGGCANGLDSPVCLGYFGHVDIQKIQNFKEYVRGHPDMGLIKLAAASNCYYIESTVSSMVKLTLQVTSSDSREVYLSVLFLEHKQAYVVAQH